MGLIPGGDRPVLRACALLLAMTAGGCGDDAVAPTDPVLLPQGPQCEPGLVPLEDGGCRSAGVPAERCAQGFEPDGEGGCRAIVPASPCRAGDLAVPGESSCHPVASCGSGTWGDIPVEPGTQHVDASYLGMDSDGSSARPWLRIQQGVEAATPGGLVAIAAGRYAEDVDVVGKTVRLWGRCPALVSLEGIGSYSWALSFEQGSAGSEAHGLAVSGPVDAVLVSGATGVLLERLWIHGTGTGEWGLDVQDDLGAAEATLRESLVEATQTLGVLVTGGGAALEIDRSAVRDVASTSWEATAVMVQTSGHLRMTQSLVERPPDYGVRAVGAVMSLEGVLVRRQVGAVETQAGVLVSANEVTGEASDAALTGVVVEAGVSRGIGVVGSRARVEATTVLAPRPSATFGVAAALWVSRYEAAGGPSDVELYDSVLREAQGAAVLVFGGRLGASGVLVRDVLPDALTRKQGFGFSIQADRRLLVPSEAEIRHSVVERAADVAVSSSGSELSLRGVRISDTRPKESDGTFGQGAHVQHDKPSDLPASLTLYDVLIERSHEFGIAAQDASLYAERVTVRETSRRASDATFGDGIALISSRGTPGTLLAVQVEGSARAGLASFGTTVSVASSRLSCNAIDMVAEGNFGVPGTIEGLGENWCGCGADERICRAISAGLAPPPPLEP